MSMGSNRSIPQFVKHYLTTADAHGITLPSKVREELDRRMRVIDAAAALDFTGSSIPEAVNDALESGVDPFTSPSIQEAIIMQKLREMTGTDQITEVARNRLLTYISQNADELVEAFKSAYDAAGQQLAGAHQVMTANGIKGVDDPLVPLRGMDIARANVEAREALHLIQKLEQALNSIIVAASKLDPTPIGRSVWTLDTGDATATDVIRASDGGRHVSLWQGLTAGFTISLATPTENTARRDRAYAAEERAQAASDARGRQAISSYYHGAGAGTLAQ